MAKKPVKKVIRVRDKYYILAESSLADETIRVLKHNETFGIFNSHGDIRPFGFENHGVFHEGTRFLSRWDLKIDGKKPLLLGSNLKGNNDYLFFDLTNPDLMEDTQFYSRGTIHLARSIFIYEKCFYERIKLFNYGLKPVRFSISIDMESDFRDIFEIRGVNREKRGAYLDPVIKTNEVILQYKGLDGIIRKTIFNCRPDPNQIDGHEILYTLELRPQEEKTLDMIITCLVSNDQAAVENFSQGLEKIRKFHKECQKDSCYLKTSDDRLNAWINQSHSDLLMLMTQTPQGLYPFAGIPWFSTFFGRDGIWTALETLWIYPQIARGVLNYLAFTQAKTIDPVKEAEPGKIIHEQRKGEMASLNEIPFGLYYGSVDATPLFVVLAGHYFDRTADREFISHIWPNIEAALNWIDVFGDQDRDGFVEYSKHSTKGLFNQGWKDSNDSIFYEDGTIAEFPIALCEVQGYVYEAKKKAAHLASVLGLQDRSRQLNEEAEYLRSKFIEKFWCDDIGTYAIALDGKKRPCKIRSSNAGHCLFSGIADQEHAKRIAKKFFSPSFYTGWGIRTLASTEPRYNPMSYHNGTIWPHDNAIISEGLNRYGHKEEIMKIFLNFFDASIFMSARLPELFCGFERRNGEGPTLYPVSCDPQAWASGSFYMILKASLGLSINAQENRIYFYKPQLPDQFHEIEIRNLKIGTSTIDLSLHKHPDDVGIFVKKKDGDVEIINIK